MIEQHKHIQISLFKTPSTLQEHFNNKHGGGDVEGHVFKALKTKRTRFDSRGTLPRVGFVSVDKPLLLALYKVAYKVVKSKKFHTIAELITPCVLDMYISYGTVKEDFLFCEELITTTMGNDVYQFVKDFFAKLLTVCAADGVPMMLGNKSGFSVLMKKIPHLQLTRCFLHRHALTAKTLPPKLKKVFDNCVKTIDWIRGL
ncbi:protein FAM200C-like [Oratosquilla oratoria]|uniref:protein FAM200C-like n=1 Tax=Oratosquilla oratoria TaxID=337810 RepID=UPI003F75D213